MGWYSDYIEEPISNTWEAVKEDPWKGAAILATGGLATTVLATGAAVAPVASSVMTAIEQKEAGKLAKEQGQANADAAAAFTAEQVRVVSEENERRESLARATAAASGAGGASSEIYIASLEEAGRSDIDWLKEAGAYSYNAAIASGESAYHSAQAAMWGSIGQAASGVVSMGTSVLGLNKPSK